MAQEGISSSSEVPETTPSTIVDISLSDIKYVSYEGEEQLPLIMNIVDQELSEPYSIFTYRYFVHLWPHLCFLKTNSACVHELRQRQSSVASYKLHTIAEHRQELWKTHMNCRSRERSGECSKGNCSQAVHSSIAIASGAVTVNRIRAFHEEKCVGTIVCKMGQHRNTFRGYIAMLVVIKPYRGKKIATELVTRSIHVMRESGCEEVTLEAEVTNKGALALYGNLGFIRVKRLFRYYLNGVDAFRLKLLFPRPDPLFMLNEENFNMDLSHQFSHEGSHNCNEHKDCSEHCDDFI